MKGNCEHDVGVITEESEWINGQRITKKVPAYIRLSNDDDTYYWQGFETREEVEAFIEQLKAAADQAFGGKNG